MRPTRLIEHATEVTRLAPARPAAKAGLRAAIAIFVPLAVASALHLPGGIWLSIGAFNSSFADKGGSYRSRASSMAAVALAGAFASFFGALCSHPAFLAVPATLVWVTLASYAGVYGPAASFAGNTASSAFVISLAIPGSGPSEAFARLGYFLAGAAWSMALSLLLWPVRPFRPARKAVAAAYRALEAYAAEVGKNAGNREGAEWARLVTTHHPAVRQALEAARGTLAETRRGRTEHGRGERLLVMLAAADASFETLIALADELESLAGRDDLKEVGSLAGRLVLEQAVSYEDLARIAQTEREPKERPHLGGDSAVLRALVGALPPTLAPVARAQAAHATRLVGQLHDYAANALESASGLVTGRSKALEGRLPDVAPETGGSLVEPLRENLSPASVVLRHALRLGVTTAVAVAITRFLGHGHGYWVTITVLTILQPYTGPTFLRGLQRVLGTVVGGVLAALVAAQLHDPQGITLLAFCTAGLSVALMPVNYGIYTVFLTLTFVLLAEVGTGDWSLAHVRIVNTLIGGGLALAGSWLLWERPEHEQFPELLADTFRADRTYLDEVFARLRGAESAAALNEARRRMGLAAINAEASFQRLLSEPRRRTEPLEPLMTLLTFARRLGSALIAISSTDPQGLSPAVRERLDAFAAAVACVLEDLSSAISGRRPPAPLPDFATLLGHGHGHPGGALPPPLLTAHLERVVRQLSVLHGAATRRAGRS